MDKVTPKCPYCGTGMVIRDWHDIFFGRGDFFECVCGARSPIKASQEAAYAAAMRRYAEPLKPLKLQEVTGSEESCVFIELKGNEAIRACDCVISSDLQCVEISLIGSARPSWMPINLYGKKWRCWLRRPTDEERAKEAWK